MSRTVGVMQAADHHGDISGPRDVGLMRGTPSTPCAPFSASLVCLSSAFCFICLARITRPLGLQSGLGREVAGPRATWEG